MLRKKPLIALLEPDTTEQHGGFTEAQCRAILRDEMIVHGPGGMVPFSERLQDLYEEVGKWSDGWAEPVQLPTAKEIEDALFASAPIIWSPLADFQDVSLRLIAERTLPDFAHAYGSPYQQMTYVQGEIETRLREFVPRGEDGQKSSSRRRGSFGSRLSSGTLRLSAARQFRAVSKASFHFYVSSHSSCGRAIAEEVAALLSHARLPPLRWTDDLEKLDECEHMLVHLDSTTWTRGAESDALAHEICQAMRAGVHRLLAHEVPGARLDDVWRCGCSFDDLIEATPAHLKRAGIYNEIAMNLAGGEWRTAGLAGLVRAIYKGGGSRKQWLVEPMEPPRVNRAQRPSVLSTVAQSRIQVEPSSDHPRRGSQLPPGIARRSSQLPPSPARRSSSTPHGGGEQQPPPSPLEFESATCHSKLSRQATGRRLTLKMDHRRASSQGCLKEGPGRMGSSREQSRRSSLQATDSASRNHNPNEPDSNGKRATFDDTLAERPHQFRLAKFRRSSSREEALARKASVSATSRPERLLRACVKMPGQAVRVVQTGVDILQTCAAALATRPPEEDDSSMAAHPQVGRGWKSGRLRDAIRGGCLASAAAEPVAPTENEGRKIEDLKAMVLELQAQLSAKEESLAGYRWQSTDLGNAGRFQEIGEQAGALPRMLPPVARKESLRPAGRKSSIQLGTPEARERSIDLPEPSALPHPNRNGMAAESATRQPELARPAAAAARLQHSPQGPLTVGRRLPTDLGREQEPPAVSQRRFCI